MITANSPSRDYALLYVRLVGQGVSALGENPEMMSRYRTNKLWRGAPHTHTVNILAYGYFPCYTRRGIGSFLVD